jgi:hypothetical protein
MKITIREPYWGFWTKYNLPQGTWGISIAKDKVKKAFKDAEVIEVTILKMGKFKIKPIKIINYVEKHHTKSLARLNNRTVLYGIPGTLLEKA